LAENDALMLARTYFTLGEYKRAAHFLRNGSSKKSFFLRVFAVYLAGEKKNVADVNDGISENEINSNVYANSNNLLLHRV
jgi:hypothetical protein